MKNLNADSKELTGFNEIDNSKRYKLLLTCRILSSLIWIGGDIIISIMYEGYSFTSQAISELSAIGAPTKSFLTFNGFIYEILLLAFGFGQLQVKNAICASREFF